MFYVTTLEHEIVLEPVYFGPKLRSTIVKLLKEEVEGLVSVIIMLIYVEIPSITVESFFSANDFFGPYLFHSN